MKKLNLLRKGSQIAFYGALLAVPPFALAQDSEDDEVFELSPFSVDT